jgi:antirestriction protein ArdC
MQDPDATVIRAYGAWQAEGRQVRRGEHGIQILAPAGQSGEKTREDAAGRDDAKAADGEPVRRFFRIVTVFDIRQTDPIDPTVTEDQQ